MIALLMAAALALPCYRAEVRRVVDGDTIDLSIEAVHHTDVAFGVTASLWVERRVRLLDVRAPETGGPYAEVAERAKALLGELTASGEVEVCPVLKRTGKVRETFGRIVASVRVDGEDVGAALIAAGVAKPGRAEGWD